MQIQVFKIPVESNSSMMEEMNKFLRSNKIVDIAQEFLSDNTGAYWCFCIKYLSDFNASSYNEKQRHNKIDYKEILEEEVFKKFTRLREIRKVIAESEALPAYAIFTDKELSEIAGLDEISESYMKKIEGIGDKKIEKYGKKFIEEMQRNSLSSL